MKMQQRKNLHKTNKKSTTISKNHTTQQENE
jgi:hypothetical protein